MMSTSDPVLGTLHHHADFPSRFVNPRPVDVWLPPDWEKRADRLRVLYMHDGQNLFDPALAYGGVDWGMDEAVVRLMEAGRTPPMMIVAPWNCGENRWREYMPQKAAERSRSVMKHFLKTAKQPPFSDNYLRFLVEELKPFIDTNYPTLTGQAHTFVMGSSMGGLISLYAIEQYPHVFGGAGCVSTHWLAGLSRLVDALATALPAPGAHKLYFDYGTETLDKGYEPYQLRMDEWLRRAGYIPGKDWLTRKFEGAAHNEASWQERVHIPLEFLLGHE